MDAPGTTIRRLRRWRGISLEQAAGLAGLSKGYLSKIETGKAPIERRSTLISIADALRVSLADITGDGLEIRDQRADRTIPNIRAALLDVDLDDNEPPQGRLPALVSEAQLLAGLRQASRDAEVGSRLPALLTALHTHSGQADGLRALVTATHTTALLVKGLGAPDLAWIAAPLRPAASAKPNGSHSPSSPAPRRYPGLARTAAPSGSPTARWTARQPRLMTCAEHSR